MELHDKKIVGWWEWVQLPKTNLEPFKAKVDSGAETSCIHASNIEEFEKDGLKWVRFTAHGDDNENARHEAPVFDVRKITSSNGEEQKRYVIRTDITIGDETYNTQFTLAARDSMKYRMLLGKRILGPNFLISADQEAVQGMPNAS